MQPPGCGGSEPSLSITSCAKVPVAGLGLCTETQLQGGPEPEPPALPGHGGVVEKLRLFKDFG